MVLKLLVFVNMVYVELSVIIVTLVVIIIVRIKWRQQYWKRKGLPYLEPSIPFGNIENPFTRKLQLGIVLQNFYNELKQMGVQHGGVYSMMNPLYIPVDPDILKNILLKDFQHFNDRGFYYNEKDEPLSAHLFALSGQKWRNLRTKLTPTFTSGKMKLMFESLVQCANNMNEAIYKYQGTKQGLDIKDILARYTTDVIGTCAFGLECNSFQNEYAEFRQYGKEIFKPNSRYKSFLLDVAFAKPDLGRKLGVKIFSNEASSFFTNVVKDTIKYREDNNVKRNDMFQLLMDLKNVESDGLKHKNCEGNALSINEIAAQAFVFFVAGFETSSTTMTFCLYELAVNPNVQKRVRDEINDVLKKHNGEITYEAIMEMKYMGQVIDETLRKYPPLSFLSRKCVDDYHVPGTDIILERGQSVFISVLGFHHDPEYFPNPEMFDPERFSEENKPKILPFTYIPFGEGPRICIGLRFGLMQTKVGLTVLIRNYIILLNKKTATPFKMDRNSFILTAKEGVFLNIESIHNYNN